MRRALLLLAAGCGRIGFDFGPVDSGASDDDAPGDAMVMVDAAPLGAFGPPVRIIELTSAAADDDPSLTDDQLELYFETIYAPGEQPPRRAPYAYYRDRASPGDHIGADSRLRSKAAAEAPASRASPCDE